MYFTGLGVEQDKKEALKWYRLSAEQGNAKAQSVHDIIERLYNDEPAGPKPKH